MSITKTCRRCERVLPVAEFHRDKNRRDGRYAYCKPCNSLAAKAWYDTHPEQRRDTSRRNRLKTRFGITPEQFDKMLEAQGGCCAICGSDSPGFTSDQTRFHVDHDHQTGRVRGILCGHCNVALGHLRDSLELVERAAAYLRGRA